MNKTVNVLQGGRSDRFSLTPHASLLGSQEFAPPACLAFVHKLIAFANKVMTDKEQSMIEKTGSSLPLRGSPLG